MSKNILNTKKIYGYLRVSTEKQDLEGNKKDIQQLCIKLEHNPLDIIWIEESITGTKHWKDRKLNLIVERVKKDDIILMSEISRISRKFLDIIEFFSVIQQKGALLHFTKSNFKIDNSIQSNALVFAYSISAQLERELISQRTKSALAKRKAEGQKLGRPKGSFRSKLDQYYNEIKLDLDQKIPKTVIAKKYNTSYANLLTFLKKKQSQESQNKII